MRTIVTNPTNRMCTDEVIFFRPAHKVCPAAELAACPFSYCKFLRKVI
ncbi:MAG: hypothetical protein IJN42_02725 [Clostridia bacterium]|nr:hypothetical protein [Clostridia bacterium]